MPRKHHYVTNHALVDGRSFGTRCGMSYPLIEGAARLRGARQTAQIFHAYEITTRDDTHLHIAYARRTTPHGDVINIFEIAHDAVMTACGLGPTG